MSTSLWTRGIGAGGLLQRQYWATMSGTGISSTITVGNRAAGDVFTPPAATGVVATHRVLNESDIRVRDGKVLAGTLMFRLQVSSMGGASIAPRDQLIDTANSNATYYVDWCELQCGDQEWYCEVTKAN